MKASFDSVNGGFRDAPKFFEPDAITLAFRLNDQSPTSLSKRWRYSRWINSKY